MLNVLLEFLFISVRKDKIELPDCNKLTSQMRACPEYIEFCKIILRCCYGVNRWKAKVANTKICNFVQPSFEAFALLCYENVYETYKDYDDNDRMVENQEVIGSEKRKFKYTMDSRLSGQNKGWPPEAVLRYNKLRQMVIQSRIDNQDFDNDFLDNARDEQKGRKRKKKKDINEVVILAENDINDAVDWNAV